MRNSRIYFNNDFFGYLIQNNHILVINAIVFAKKKNFGSSNATKKIVDKFINIPEASR
jgi:hypothetical protein